MVELECDKEGEYPFILQYRENSGSWEPKYEVRFMGEGNPLDVYMKAKIYFCTMFLIFFHLLQAFEQALQFANLPRIIEIFCLSIFVSFLFLILC